MKNSYKRLITILFMLAVILFLNTQASAAGTYLQDIEKSVPEKAAELLDDADINSASDIGSAGEKLLASVFSEYDDILKNALKNGVALISVSVFCSLAISLCGKEKARYVILASVAAAAAMSISGTKSLIGGVADVVEDLYAFSNILLPVLATAEAAVGYITSASAKLASATLFMDVLVVAERKLVIPLIYAFVSLSAASAVFGGAIKSLAKLIKWLINTLLIVIITTFTAYLTVTGVVTSSADAVTVKATKTAISTMLPVVGKLASDAADSVASGFNVIKNTAGAFGIIVICAVCLKPLLKVLSNFFVFKAAGAISEAIVGNELSDFISDVGTAMGLSAAVAGSCAIMLYIAVVSVMKVTGSL